MSLKITFLYSSPRSPINFSKALSVGAKTVNGPGDCSASVNPALPKRKIREIEIYLCEYLAVVDVVVVVLVEVGEVEAVGVGVA